MIKCQLWCYAKILKKKTFLHIVGSTSRDKWPSLWASHWIIFSSDSLKTVHWWIKQLTLNHSATYWVIYWIIISKWFVQTKQVNLWIIHWSDSFNCTDSFRNATSVCYSYIRCSASINFVKNLFTDGSETKKYLLSTACFLKNQCDIVLLLLMRYCLMLNINY